MKGSIKILKDQNLKNIVGGTSGGFQPGPPTPPQLLNTAFNFLLQGNLRAAKQYLKLAVEFEINLLMAKPRG